MPILGGAITLTSLFHPFLVGPPDTFHWLSCKVINIPLVDDEDVVDTATLRDAKPLGILRVVVAWPS